MEGLSLGRRRPLVFRVVCSGLCAYEAVACFSPPHRMPTITNLSVRYRWIGPAIIGTLIWDFVDIQRFQPGKRSFRGVKRKNH